MRIADGELFDGSPAGLDLHSVRRVGKAIRASRLLQTIC
jgi:hypothetical protein